MTDEATDQSIRRRSPVLAEILSFIMTGLGQIYAGRFGKGLVLFFVSFFCGTIGAFALLPIGAMGRTICLVFLGVGFAVWVYSIIDARHIAKRAPDDYRLKDYNRWYVYVLLVLLQMPAGIGWSMYVRSGIIHAFQIAGNGMAPTIQLGERVLVNKLAYQSAPVQRGDIVALINPNNRSQTNIKRVVALPGDRVEVVAGELILNGKRIDSPIEANKGAEADAAKMLTEELGGHKYPITVSTAPPQKAESLPETVIPNGQCLVLNDNRVNTYDSRRYGLVPLRDIVGRVDYIYWPRWSSLNP
jgi:signal peptidase I